MSLGRQPKNEVIITPAQRGKSALAVTFAAQTLVPQALGALFILIGLTLIGHNALAADRVMLPRIDNIDIRGYTIAGPGHAIRGTFAGGACALLTTRPDTKWNIVSPCKVMQILNGPRLGRMVQEGPDGFYYQARAAGVDSIRYVVDNTQGRRAVVTLHIEVINNGGQVLRSPPRGSGAAQGAGDETPIEKAPDPAPAPPPAPPAAPAQPQTP